MRIITLLLRWIDIPPGWLALSAAAAWGGLDALIPPGLGFGWTWSRVLGDG